MEDNYDYSSYLDDLDGLMTSWVDDRAFLPTMLTYGLTFVCGILGNVILIVKLTSSRRARRRSVTSLFLLSLAISDLVFVLFCIPYDVISKTFSHWSAGLITCKMSTFVEMMCAQACVLCLTAVSVERHVVIVYPMKARRWCTTANYRRLVVLVWTLAAILATPTLLLVGTTSSVFFNNHTRLVLVTCSEVGTSLRMVIAWYQVGVTFIIPTFLIGCCSYVVIRVLWVSTQRLYKLTNQRRSAYDNAATLASIHHVTSRSELRLMSGAKEVSTITAARKQVIKMLLTIVAVFLICWGPKSVLNMMRRYSLHILHTDTAFYCMLIANLLPFVHSCVNPVIYGLMMRRNHHWLLRRLSPVCCGHSHSSRDFTNSLPLTSMASSTWHRPSVVQCHCVTRPSLAQCHCVTRSSLATPYQCHCTIPATNICSSNTRSSSRTSCHIATCV